MYNTRPTFLEVNLDNLKENFLNIKSIIKEDTKVCTVVKADAYAHGSIQIAKILQGYTDYFAVSTLEEAIELRKNNIIKPLLCLGYIPKKDFIKAIQNNVEITIYSLESAYDLNNISKSLDKTSNIHIKLDTGMSRIGFQVNDETVNEIKKIYELSNINIIGIYSHFATADEDNKSFTHKQYERYKYIVDKLNEIKVYIPIKHICNSAGIIDFPQYHLDMVRCGIITYGHYPSKYVNKNKLKLKPVMTLKSTLSHVKLLESNIGIGYGLRYSTKCKTKIGTIPIGYADGLSRLLSGKINVMIKDALYPLVGSICMDQVMVDLKDNNFNVGEEVIIFGDYENLTVETIAQALGTINYEVFCMLGRRIPRVYLQGNNVLHVLDYLVK